MRDKLFLAAACVAFVAPNLAEAGNPKSVSPYAKYSMEELRAADKCREEITYLWSQIGPLSASLLERDFLLNVIDGTMHTADVQHMRKHIRDKFNDTKYHMLGAFDAEKCADMSDDLIEYVVEYIDKHRY
jgi:hypothetical protein